MQPRRQVQVSQHEPFPDVETDGPHHHEANREKDARKLRVHLHHAHNARVISQVEPTSSAAALFFCGYVLVGILTS
jgi:hypothetical protein